MKKSTIFDKRFEQIFTPERIAFVSKSYGYVFDADSLFDFAPHKRFYIPKNEDELRQINVPDIKAKIVQRILLEELSAFFRFSDRNYAYQKGKSPAKAVNRAKNFTAHHTVVLKCDIDNFFDTIDHDILLHILRQKIADAKILFLIALFLKNGALFQGRWYDKFEGVYQGDVLSPFLSNLYMDAFDRAFERYDFLRFADDMIFFVDSFEEATILQKRIENFLQKLKLRLDPKKGYIRHISKKFEFLGVVFDVPNRIYSIDNDRLMQKISTLSKETRMLDLPATIEKINEHVRGFMNYYLKVINNTRQFELLQKREDEILIQKVVYAKLNKIITRKQRFIKLLENVLTYMPQQGYAHSIVERAYEAIKLKEPVKSAQKKIASQKRNYLKKSLRSSEIVVATPGTFLGYAAGRCKIKPKGGPTQKVPFGTIRRILITTKRASISTYLIYKCAQKGIPIDLMDERDPYAQILYAKAVPYKLHVKQLLLALSPRAHRFATSLLFAKAKNQINLLKYYNLRREDERIERYIDEMERLLHKLKRAASTKSLMGLEGQIAQLYWNSFGILAQLGHFTRTHRGASDPINQALNYGYAILYSRLQSALVEHGFNIYYSFLHRQDHSKPTLVYDMVEPFRQPVVDREILAMLAKRRKITQTNGRLSAESKKMIVQAIQERLATPTRTRYGKVTYEYLITKEVQSFKKAVEESKETHRFFIAKY